MIILSLLHPVKQIPVQVWTFPTESVIRIGRSTDNQVILYSAVVSRRHVELRRVGLEWEVVSLGTNGTYLNGKRITQTNITDGAIIRLARSGPNIQVRMGEAAFQELSESLPASRIAHQRSDTPMVPTEITGRPPQLHEETVDRDADSETRFNF
ncbi:MAG: FHA domain-containing protein [Cyanobacteria bacterium RM1_2_2]|nr:FHA domain-containing protein [Cyanobacteria bacterium RM1_2_2]